MTKITKKFPTSDQLVSVQYPEAAVLANSSSSPPKNAPTKAKITYRFTLSF
jgi:hypothetical protein